MKKLFLFLKAILHPAAISGTTGRCRWKITGTDSRYTLTISGNGAMGNYYWNNSRNAPWYAYRHGIQTLKLEQGVTDIGKEAFYECSSLKDVTVEWTTPLSVDRSIFDDVPLAMATLHVPRGTKALYQAADGWKEFKTIIEDGKAA